MPFFIAHRGNTSGPNPTQENNPLYIIQTLAQGYDVEVDTWHIDNQWWLGHDKPSYQLDCIKNLGNLWRIWFHAKNLEALAALKATNAPHFFWHQQDDFALTSCGLIWTYPGKQLTESDSIAVLPEQVTNIWTKEQLSKTVAICSDFA